MQKLLWSIVAGTVLLLSACGDDDAGNAGSGGSAGSAGFAGFAGTGGGSGGAAGVGATGGDGGTAGSGATGGTGDGPWSVPALPFHVTPGTPFNAPARQWSFVGFPESKCANGTPTGIAVNPIENAVGVLVFMQGGGACWDAETCLVLKASVHLEDTVGESVVLAEAGALSGLFDHDNVLNPFRQYAYVYMPYCTGDLHSGSQAQVYNAGAGDVTIQHHGGRNVELYLERLIATFPSVERVVVSGISAGGYGATLNWWRYQGAFPNARVDILDDAGLMVDAPDTRWSAMHDAWAMAVPPGCDECDQRASAWLPFYGVHLVAPRRYALTAFLGDAVIGSYFGLSAAQIETQMLALRTGAAANQKTFFLPGTLHSVIAEGTTTMTSDGTSLLPWVLQFASDDPNWNHAGP